jgi:hypothetical protein
MNKNDGKDRNPEGQLGALWQREKARLETGRRRAFWQSLASTLFFFFGGLGLLYFSVTEWLRTGFHWGLLCQFAFSLAVLSGAILGLRNRWREILYGSSWPEDWWSFHERDGLWRFSYQRKKEFLRNPEKLVRVALHTNASGPFGADLWVLLDFEGEERLAVPLGRNLRDFQDRLLKLPKFHLENFIESSLSAEPGEKVCWERQGAARQT